MSIDLVQHIRDRTAVKIAAAIESAARDALLASGERLPTVRRLAEDLDVSPATVASAYRMLRERGLVVTDGRRGTRVGHRPIPPSRRRPPPVRGARNLHDGNPDPALLVPLEGALASIDTTHHLYGAPPHDAGLVKLMTAELRADGVACDALCVVNGAMDGIDRVAAEHLRPGDRVAVEDPAFVGVLDLLTARGLSLVPVALDQDGMRPDSLEAVLRAGVDAVAITPRAQSPTGAALTETRAAALRRVLARRPDVLIIEDDHANRIAGAPLHVVHDRKRRRWAHVHSFNKCLSPDLRMAVVTGDRWTMDRVQDRFVVGERWVSHLLQRLVRALLSDRSVCRGLRRAAATYARRREALLAALRHHGFPAVGRSGYNVWLPVTEETPTVQALAAAGWAVSAGERYRLQSAPGVRITAATLEPQDAARLAADLCASTDAAGVTPVA